MIILGEASHATPELLLSIATEGIISNRELGEAATMLPENFVDKKAESIRELRARVERFRSVRNRKLSGSQSYVLERLQGAIKEMESAG